MLKSISAQAVLFGILILTVIYYAIILAIYYRRELKSLLQGKAFRSYENGQQEAEKKESVK